MKILVASLFFVAVVVCCTNPPTFSDNAKEVVRDEVRTTLNNYCDAIRKDGLLAEFGYLDNSKEFFWTPPGYRNAISYDSVAKVIRLNAAAFSRVDNSFDTLHIVPVSPELATYSARIISNITDTSGKTTSFKLVETGVVIRRNDGWKLLSGQTSMVSE